MDRQRAFGAATPAADPDLTGFYFRRWGTVKHMKSRFSSGPWRSQTANPTVRLQGCACKGMPGPEQPPPDAHPPSCSGGR